MNGYTVQAENARDLSDAAEEPGLSGLVAHIDHEIAEALRFEEDDSSPAEENRAQKSIGRHICVLLAGKRLAFPLAGILEAGVLQMVQSLPLLPDWLTGITNIRSEIVSVVNLGRFLGCKTISQSDGQPYLIVHDDEIKIVITVDRILGTRSLFLSNTENSQGTPDEIQLADYFAGRAFYLEKDTDKEMEVDVFDLDGLLSSRRLLDFITL